MNMLKTRATKPTKQLTPWQQLPQKQKFRPEIQGLRALAVLLVASYHFWFGRVSGGVDVFLLISAFLLTGSFYRKIESASFTGFTTVLRYWIHVFKRILPLASITVAATLVATFFFLPQERWLTIADEAKSVLLYRENWWSIKNLVDYYAVDSSAASPLRHFWSLSVQGQIYILWPLIFLLAWLLIKFLKLPTRATLLTLFSLIFAGSLTYSVYLTQLNQQTAYYNTWARLWEFALGSLAALLLDQLKLGPLVRSLLGWLGIILIVSCGFVLDVQGKFPGYHALWPALAACMVILAGQTGSPYGPEKLLTIKPLLKLGNISYALYLVHWPLLVFYLHRVKQEKAGFVAGLLLLAASIVLAWILTRCLEKPLLQWKWGQQSSIRALGIVSGCMLLGLVPAYGWSADINQSNQRAMQNQQNQNIGAAILETGLDNITGDEQIPRIPVRTSGSDWADQGPECASSNPQWSLDEKQQKYCFHTVENEQPSRTVLAVGNSHMHMWAPALRAAAQQEGWDLVMMTMGGCFYGLEDIREDQLYEHCLAGAQSMQKLIDQLNPDLVIVTGTLSQAQEPDVLLTGMQNRIRELTSQGKTVIGIRDTPRLAVTHKECMDQKGKTEADCVMEPGQDVYRDPQQQLEQQYSGFAALNMSDLVCPQNSCPVSIGNVYTYQDYDHLTSTYAETTKGFFVPRLLAAISRAEANR